MGRESLTISSIESECPIDAACPWTASVSFDGANRRLEAMAIAGEALSEEVVAHVRAKHVEVVE